MTTNGMIGNISPRIIVLIVVFIFSLGGVQWQFKSMKNDIIMLKEFKESTAAAQRQQSLEMHSRFDGVESLITQSTNIVAIRTHDRWTKTDDYTFMSIFAHKNNLVMPNHITTTPSDPEVQ